MITSISIRGYKSFHPTVPVVIPLTPHTPPQPVFFYGINGAGKSAIGEVLEGWDAGDASLAHCQVATSNQESFRCLVYNQQFVDRIIRAAEGVPGIFTLGVQDAATQQEIEDKEADAAKLQARRVVLREQITKSKDSGKAVQEVAITNAWKAHSDHAQPPFRELLNGYHNDKKKFFTDLEGYTVPDDTVLDTLDQLKERLLDANSSESSQPKLALDLSGLASIEKDPIWVEPIAVSGASRLAPLIEELANSDWVGQGRKYTHKDACPFCQQKLPADFVAELALLLDGDRQSKVDRIQALNDSYATKAEAIEVAAKVVLAHPFAQQEPTVAAGWELVHAQMRANASAMRSKIDKPGEVVAIEPTDIEPLKTAIATANDRITAFNLRVADRGLERDRIRTMFWQVLRRDRAPVYETYHAHKAPLVEALLKDREEDAAVGKALQVIDERLRELRSKETGVGAAVDRINVRLASMGVTGYSIARKVGEGNLYCLCRPGQAQGDMKTLSEGEKTLISFLYYLEMLAGSESAEGEAVDLGKTVAVIDDPISSLSHNFVFDVASIVYRDLIKPADGQPRPRQTIVLTHNLFFLHELLRQLLRGAPLEKAVDKCQLWRVVKTDYTTVAPMKATELMNDYQALWQVLKDARAGSMPAIMVPNAMRCILEHFFWFTHQEDKFQVALERVALEDGTFTPLARFLNRGSHKDGINITVMDFNQYDLNYYFTKFKAVFQAAGFEDHYVANLGEEPSPSVPVAVLSSM